MNDNSKVNLGIGIGLIAIVIAIGAYFYPQAQTLLGGVTNYDTISASGLQVGSNCNNGFATCSSTTFANLIGSRTTCVVKADGSITATTSGYAYCTGVTGVTSSDNVLAQFATSTANWVLGSDAFNIVSAKASTTAGAIDFLIANWTGKNAAPSAVGQAASTTVIYVFH